MESATATPKGPKASATKQKIIDAAARLVYQRGFHATSLDMVAQAARVNRGSLYYFFRSKKNLGLAIIDHYESLLHQNYLSPSFDIQARGREKSGVWQNPTPVCRFRILVLRMPIGNLSLELSALDEEMRVRLKEVWDGVFDRIALVLAQSQREGDLPGRITPLVFARSISPRFRARISLRGAPGMSRLCAKIVSELS